jgi:hypothetical protein
LHRDYRRIYLTGSRNSWVTSLCQCIKTFDFRRPDFNVAEYIARCTFHKTTFNLYPGLQGESGYWEEPPFESNFSWGFWFGSSGSLHYMHGAGSKF